MIKDTMVQKGLHTDSEYERELNRLRELILQMGAAVEQMIEDSLTAFDSKNADLARKVIDRDPFINRLEMESDDLCLQILARRQPVASDLRFITIAMKLVTDFERMGDLCVNCCERTLELCEGGKYNTIPELRKMAKAAKKMVRDAFESFIEEDDERAMTVLEADNEVDQLYADAFHKLLTTMETEGPKVSWASKIQSIAKYLERLADHATNVAELVVFMVRGKDVRHISSREEPTP